MANIQWYALFNHLQWWNLWISLSCTGFSNHAVGINGYSWPLNWLWKLSMMPLIVEMVYMRHGNMLLKPWSSISISGGCNFHFSKSDSGFFAPFTFFLNVGIYFEMLMLILNFWCLQCLILCCVFPRVGLMRCYLCDII